jgi:hypothetical protein
LFRCCEVLLLTMPSIPNLPLTSSKIVVLRSTPVDANSATTPSATGHSPLAAQEVVIVKDQFAPEKLINMENSRLLMNTYNAAEGLYQNEAIMQNVGAALGNVGQSLPRTLAVSTISASRKNVQDLINGKKPLSEIGGAVVADVSAAVVTSGLTLAANQTAVTALSRLGASSPIAIAGGMVLGFTANRVTTHLIEEKQVKNTISNKGNAIFQQSMTQVVGHLQIKPKGQP